MITFRFDDVSVNTNMAQLSDMVLAIRQKHGKNANVIMGISLMTHDMSSENGLARQRLFPSILNAYSDHRLFYKVQKCGLPGNWPFGHGEVTRASHGLIHVDHRLLSRDVQEFNIMVSSSIVQADIFIPPFNKWNADTESVCREHNIRLVKFEDGWKHLAYHKVSGDGLYYIHTHDMTSEEFATRL